MTATGGDASGMADTTAETSIFKSAITDIRDLLTCRVCLKLLYEPFTTGCGHTFCYECLNHWFKNKAAKSCPDCRERIRNQPVQAFAIREMVSVLCKDSRLLPDGEEKDDHIKMRNDTTSLLEQHKKGPTGIFEGAFSRPELREAIRDASDGIWRCPCCYGELEDMYCPSCGDVYDDNGQPRAPSSFWGSDVEPDPSEFSVGETDSVGDIIDVDAIEEGRGPGRHHNFLSRLRDRQLSRADLLGILRHERLSAQQSALLTREISGELGRILDMGQGSNSRPIHIPSGNSVSGGDTDDGLSSEPPFSESDISGLIDDEYESSEDISDEEGRVPGAYLDDGVDEGEWEDYPSSVSNSLGARSPSIGRPSSDRGDGRLTPSLDPSLQLEDTQPVMGDDHDANFSDPEEDSVYEDANTGESQGVRAGRNGRVSGRSEPGQEEDSDTVGGAKSSEKEGEQSNDDTEASPAMPRYQRNRKRIRAVVSDDSDDDDDDAALESEGRSSQRRRFEQTVELSDDDADDEDIRPASRQRKGQGIASQQQRSTASSAPLRSTVVVSSDEDEGPISARRSRTRQFSVTHPVSRNKADEAPNREAETVKAR